MKLKCVSAVAIASVLALSGCGGGDGSSGAPPSPGPTNNAPSFGSAAAAVSVPENGQGVVATLSASDSDGDSLTYSLGGADAAAFSLSSSGELQFLKSPNFDLPTDSGFDNVYDVTVSANDGKASAQLAVAVTVTNLKEGIALRRIATGIDAPVGMDLGPESTIIVAQADGKVWRYDAQNGSRTLEAEIDLAADGELIDVTFGMAERRDFYRGVVAMARDSQGIDLIIPSQFWTPTRVTIASGAPNGATGALTTGSDGWLYAVVGDPDGTRAQGESGYGRSFVPYDPYGGASLPQIAIRKAGYGIRQPGGLVRFADGSLLFADQAAAGEHEISRFANQSISVATAMPNFGWPFYAGTVLQKNGAPAGLTGPELVYAAGDGPRQGEGVVLGGDYAGSNASLAGKFVFGDRNGAVWAVPVAALRSGAPSRMDIIEDRSEDFAPDEGTLDGIVEIKTDSSGRVFILDRDGELFVLG
ncbi:hypothetical protein LCM19_12000 [Qipengyuania flava]|nr:hypothetical protein [Qipengyuania flava]